MTYQDFQDISPFISQDEQIAELYSGYPSLQLVRSRNVHRPLVIALCVILVILFLGMIFVPWQQSVISPGQVTVFSPMQRPQTVNAQIEGRLGQWHVREGDIVESGQLLAELVEVNPKFLDQDQLVRMLGQREAFEQKREATVQLVNVLESQVTSQERLRENAVSGADVQITQADDQLLAAQQALTGAEQAFETAELNYHRRKELFQRGLRSKRDFELAERDFVQAEAKMKAASAKLSIAESQQNVSRFNQGKISAESTAKLQDTEAKLAAAQEKLASVNSDILKLDVSINNLQNRVRQRQIVAPIEGQVVRALALGTGETVKAGDPIVTIVPLDQDQAVALYVADWNAPLVSKGRHVRLQFAGWPAIQFSGWPSIAVGTFGGTVKVVDSVDDGRNRFRILVVPDEERIASGEDEPWPSPQYLRPGAQATGWIMLDTVPVGFELWRQLNGFPPVVDREVLKPKATVGKKK